jgi:endonuclease/exonuclease/phosphatase family metal-dependent hydrolase
MKVITLNTWGTFGPYEERWKVLLSELKRLSPDLMLLQEVADESLIHQITASLKSNYIETFLEPQLAIVSRFPLQLLEKSLYPTQSPSESFSRGFILLEVEHPVRKFAAACTHLSWKSEDTLTRCAQVRELVSAIGQSPLPPIIAGDLNDTPDSSPLRDLRQTGFRDLFESLHPGEPGVTWDNQNPFIRGHSIKFCDRRIDYLLAEPRLLGKKPKLCSVVLNEPDEKQIFPSDHYGVFAELDLS